MIECGCGKEAKWEVYEHREPHCTLCMLEAVDCREWIPVRRLDPLEYANTNCGKR
jgi:hypothetical protein